MVAHTGQNRDLTYVSDVVQGILLVIITTTLVVNLLVDLSYSFLDPRIKY